MTRCRRSRLLPATLASLSLLAPLSAAAEDIPGTDFTSGGWSGRAWADDQGKFVDCYFGVTYTNGDMLTVSLAGDDTLSVFISSQGARFTPGKLYPAHLMTDIGYPVPGDAYGTTETFVGFTLSGIDASMDYLTQGTYLRLMGVEVDQVFELRGLGGALAHARACLMTNSGQSASAAALPAKPSKPGLGSGGNGAKPAQMSGDIATFKRQHMPCKDDTCK